MTSAPTPVNPEPSPKKEPEIVEPESSEIPPMFLLASKTRALFAAPVPLVIPSSFSRSVSSRSAEPMIKLVPAVTLEPAAITPSMSKLANEPAPEPETAPTDKSKYESMLISPDAVCAYSPTGTCARANSVADWSQKKAFCEPVTSNTKPRSPIPGESPLEDEPSVMIVSLTVRCSESTVVVVP